jgi:hypothetical protein
MQDIGQHDFLEQDDEGEHAERCGMDMASTAVR